MHVHPLWHPMQARLHGEAAACVMMHRTISRGTTFFNPLNIRWSCFLHLKWQVCVLVLQTEKAGKNEALASLLNFWAFKKKKKSALLQCRSDFEFEIETYNVLRSCSLMIPKSTQKCTSTHMMGFCFSVFKFTKMQIYATSPVVRHILPYMAMHTTCIKTVIWLLGTKKEKMRVVY